VLHALLGRRRRGQARRDPAGGAGPHQGPVAGNVIMTAPGGIAESDHEIVTTAPVSLAELGGYFLRLGTFGFGGPIALTVAMQRDLVQGRRWITTAEYKEGLALAQLAPGPLAAQLAIYLGWVRFGVLGATV